MQTADGVEYVTGMQLWFPFPGDEFIAPYVHLYEFTTANKIGDVCFADKPGGKRWGSYHNLTELYADRAKAKQALIELLLVQIASIQETIDRIEADE